MKTVFSNDMVLHVWAQQRQYSGRNQSGSFWFQGGELGSYGTTVALHYGDFVLATLDTFSPTTGKQISGLYHAVSCPVIRVDGVFQYSKTFPAKCYWPKGTELKKLIIASIVETAKSYASRRRDSTRAYDFNTIARKLDDLRFICERFDLKFPAGYESPEQALGASAKEIEKAERARKREAAKLAKQRAQQLAEDKEQFEDWLNAVVCMERDDAKTVYVSCPYSYRHMRQAFLTVHGDMVVTSQGAEAPLEHVRKAFKVYRRVMSAPYDGPSKEWTGLAGVRWEKNGERIRMGHFELDRIMSNGDAKAGCHLFTAEELERFYNKWMV